MTATLEGVPATDAGILRGRDILCFSHDWGGDPYSRTHLMRLLARENRILWVNSIGSRAPTASRADVSRAVRKLLAAARPIREAEPNLFVLNPLAIPAYGRPAVRHRLHARPTRRRVAGRSLAGPRVQLPALAGRRPGPAVRRTRLDREPGPDPQRHPDPVPVPEPHPGRHVHAP